MRRFAPVLSGIVIAAGCASPSAAPPPPPPPPSPVAAAPPAAPAPPPPPRVDPAEAYRAALEREVAGARRLRSVARFDGPFDVAAFRGRRRLAGVLHVTLGLGYGPHAPPVELMARAERASSGVARVLETLAQNCRRDARQEVVWTGYQTVALPEPEVGLQFFDLVPAGEVDAGGRRIALLRVVPLTAEEREAADRDAAGVWSGAASADLEVTDADQARWAPALEADDGPEAGSP